MRNATQGILYLDHNATSPLRPGVLEAMMPFLAGAPANASSRCRPGRLAAGAIANARQQLSSLLGCEPAELIFTSGGTESVNTAIHSMLALQPEHRHLVASAVEHSAVRNLLAHLERRGYEITRVAVDSAGLIDPDEFEGALRPTTALATVMLANNETGVLSPVDQLAEISHARRIPFHTDAIQAAGKHPVDFSKTRVDLASIAAHKFGGPQGVGALFVSRRIRFVPQIIGGGQESGRRAGTENVAGIVGLGAASKIAGERMNESTARLARLRDDLERRVLEAIPGARVNGHRERRIANTSNLCFPGIPSESLLIMLDQAGLCCSAGSACTTGSPAPSHVLKAMGLSDADAKSSLRFSLGHDTTADQIGEAGACIERAVKRIAEIEGG